MPVEQIIAAHPQTISTMVHIDQMKYILDNFYSVMGIPGDVVELGCNVGTTALYIRRLLNMVETGKEFHVYDSFEGLPDANEHDGNPPRLNKGNLAKEKSAFEQSFKDAGLEFPIIHKGFFGELLDENYPQKICFAFFDGDLFSSILDSFCKVYHKMSKGGIIIVHDYEGAELPGVKKACDYFLADKPEKVCEVYRGMAKIVKE
jgi:O-methyltransferase